MRVMVIVKATETSEAGVLPSPELLAAMGRYNQELAEAGVLVAAEGLKPSSRGARVRFSGASRIVTDGPFAETKEVVGGYWMIRAGSREEAIEWAKRCPAAPNDIIEIRRVYEPEDFA